MGSTTKTPNITDVCHLAKLNGPQNFAKNTKNV